MEQIWTFFSHYYSSWKSYLAALTQIMLFVEMLKFSYFFFKKQHFVKEN
jgi:hypothetical protein